MSAAATRAAQAADVSVIAAIERACFASPWTAAMLAEEIARPLARVVVREDPPGVVVAYLCAWYLPGEAHLLRIAVQPDARGRGHARALVGELLARAAAAGCEHVDLEVARGNEAAVGLYRALGFVEVGVRPRYYSAPPDDALLLRATIPRP
ncbi:MAG: ribosomal protein S18-alanine N-acetyltransferase [Nannocystaceae bacterium]|nr:ribosomal protein S18-alanine N-acetyltransferase [Nannocystaceae bacterium]